MGGLVISGGRVVDPASGMDVVGDVALIDGKVAALGTGLGGAEHVIDATGLVVAPGFIDLHAHGQSIPADRMQAFDGVTTTLDLEAGNARAVLGQSEVRPDVDRVLIVYPDGRAFAWHQLNDKTPARGVMD